MIADDHRHTAIQELGNPMIRTPNLDRLIRKGTTLTHMHIMGSTSGAVCMPSRGMMLTGRNLWNIDAPHLGEWKLWPQQLREAGYHTHGIGKWHNEKASYARCFDSGGEIFFGGMSEHNKVPVRDFDPRGVYLDDQVRVGKKFSTDLFVDAAVDFLSNYDEERPFCLYLAFTAPHDPRTPPLEFVYNPSQLPLPENFLPEHPFDNGHYYNVRDELLAPWPRTPEVIRQHLADYYGMISHMDDGIGRVLTALERSGQAENTIIIYTADHGLGVGQHGLLGKQNLYDHSIRIPFVITGPNIPQNQRRESLAYLLDWYPTLCDLLELPIPSTIEGQSFLPLIQGEKPEHRETLFSAYLNCQRMVRDSRYKLIEYFVDDERHTQLFDLLADPLEINNLLQNEPQQEALSRLRRLLESWQDRTKDPLREGNPMSAYHPHFFPPYLSEMANIYGKTERETTIQWFRNARFGLFIHYGLYSIPGRHEWMQLRERIPVAEYEKLQDDFYAEKFDADFITDLTLSAEMKYINLTTRHHDGFCLFDTQFTDFSSVNSPARRDLVAELAEQCHQKELALFLYYSHGRDWRHPHAPNNDKWGGHARPEYDPPEPTYKYGQEHDLQQYVDFVSNQITELLTNYGPIAGIWLDGIAVLLSRPKQAEQFQVQKLYDLIHSLQPQVLVSYKQQLLGTEDFCTPEREWDRKINIPLEINTTLQPKIWGYCKADDGQHKTADNVMAMLEYATSRNANLLLNTGPLPDGSIHPEDITTLQTVGKNIMAYGFPKPSKRKGAM
jgi:alpha-L-fucosidase